MLYQYSNLEMKYYFLIIGQYLCCLFFKDIWKIDVHYNRLIQFINDNTLLYNFQFGFQKGKSTHMALIVLLEKISEALDKGEYVIGVFLDFSKAFDTVNHSILLKKLELYGICDTPPKCFQDYLANRIQYVTYNNIKSSYGKINCGVPQGSILSPLLFLIYINDLSSVSNYCFSILFADDTNVFITGKEIEIIENHWKKFANGCAAINCHWMCLKPIIWYLPRVIKYHLM